MVWKPSSNTKRGIFYVAWLLQNPPEISQSTGWISLVRFLKCTANNSASRKSRTQPPARRPRC